MFKVGDKVRRKINTYSNTFELNKVYEVIYVGLQNISVKGVPGRWKASAWEICPKEKASKKEYSFVVPRTECIDKELIYKELSKDNPVAIVHMFGDIVCAILHKSLTLKADLLGMEECPPCTRMEDIKQVIKWAKKVKNAPWNNTPTKVTVGIPTI